MTYIKILNRFIETYPEIYVGDYRPADGLPNTIIVWSKDIVFLVYYDESFDYIFIIGQTESKKH